MPEIVAFATAIAPVAAVAGAGVAVYTAVESKRQAKKARSQAKKQAGMQAELAREQLEQVEWQAGEYYDISRKQMELQAQAHNIETLATLIERRSAAKPAARVYTLPVAKTYTPAQQINIAIDKLFKAG